MFKKAAAAGSRASVGTRDHTTFEGHADERSGDNTPKTNFGFWSSQSGHTSIVVEQSDNVDPAGMLDQKSKQTTNKEECSL